MVELKGLIAIYVLARFFNFETYLSQKIIVGHIIECFLQIIKLSCNE